MEQQVKLAVFAATGGVGRQVLAQAVDAGHDVAVVVRNPDKLPADIRGAGGAQIVAADLAPADAAALQPALAGADAVLSGLGPHSNADAGIASRGTPAIVAAMNAAGVRRIVAVSAAPVGTVATSSRPHPPKHDPGDGFFMRHLGARLAHLALGKVFADLARMEDLLMASGLDWTVVRPPRLTDGPLTGTYRTAYGRNLRGGTTVSRADVAHLMLRVLGQPDTVGQVIGIAD